MQKIPDAVGDKAPRNAAQLARVTRLIRLITEMKTNPRQTPETLSRALGISRSQYFQDKMLLKRLLALKCSLIVPRAAMRFLQTPICP
jgi:hypothetical protein